jgi:potassium/hydrogen antiporter
LYDGADEPWNLAIALLAIGVLAALAALLTRISQRGSVPVALVFLVLGMAAGSDGIGGIAFDNYAFAYRIGTVALVLILFDGGLNTRFDRVRPHLTPAIVLATAGVAITAAAVAAFARLLGMAWPEALLLGAVVSSTDAAAVFAVLRNSGVHLQQRVGATIELESGLNDPMAVILTVAMTALAQTGAVDVVGLVWQVPLQLAIGVALGAAVGVGCRWLLLHVPPAAAGLLPVVTLASALVSFGAATAAWGSGFLAVYVTGLVLGNRTLPDRAGLRRVHDFLAWFAQVIVFLMLGLLVFPSQLLEVAGVGLTVAAFLVLVARPVAVLPCLLPFRYPRAELAYIAWVGLRGAVPIVLASFPVLVGVDGALRVFNVVFFVVVVSVLLQGGTVQRLTRRLSLSAAIPPAAAAAVEIVSMRSLKEQIACYHVDAASAVAGAAIADIPFPADAAVMLVVRGQALLPAKGPTTLEVGDHVYVFCRPEDEGTVSLWFGRRIDE